MLVDGFGREITYLRVSVTDRCNYRCAYCMPAEGVVWKRPEEILSYEQIAEIVRAAVGLGVRKVRLTGGEPLVRPEVERLVGMLAGIRGIEDLCMTTNGSLLTAEKARALKAAGLGRVNISLDSLDAERFAEMTGGGRLADVLRGIEAAAEADLRPVKVNMVVLAETRREEVAEMEAFCGERGLELQTIRRFSLRHPRLGAERMHRPPECGTCCRLRLTADGMLVPCLFSDAGAVVDMDDVAGSIRRAVAAKPACGGVCRERTMIQTGG